MASPGSRDSPTPPKDMLLGSHWMRDRSPVERVVGALHRVELSARTLQLELRMDAVNPLPLNALPPSRVREWLEDRVRVQCQIALAKPRGASAILRSGAGQAARPEKSLIRAVATAHAWAARLEAGQPRSTVALAKALLAEPLPLTWADQRARFEALPQSDAVRDGLRSKSRVSAMWKRGNRAEPADYFGSARRWRFAR